MVSDLVSLFANSQVNVIVWLIAIDYILGIIGAVLKKEFRLGKMAKVMGKGVINYLLGFAVLELVGQAIPTLAWIVPLGFVIIVLALIGSICENLGKLGLNLPAYLKRD